MSNPEFTFITPTYNCGRFIHRCYWSLCQQTLPDWEWVIVDDASTDGTTELLRQFTDPRVRYFRYEQTKGPGVARNFAMSMARGSWLVIQDMDDFSFPNRLEKAHAAREQGFDYISSYLALVDSEYVFKGLRGWQTFKYPYSFSHGTLCGRADLLRKVGYPSYHRGEDQTIVLHLANNYNGLHIPEALYVYHENASINAKKAMFGHYYMVLQLRDMVRARVLKQSLGVYRAMMLSVAKMSLLGVFFLAWPRLYELTLSLRKKVETSGARPLTPEQNEFMGQAAMQFPIARRAV